MPPAGGPSGRSAGTARFNSTAPTLPVAAVSQPITVVPGPATTIEVSSPGMALERLTPGGTSTQPLFRVTDGYNVPTTSASVSVTIAAGNCTLISSTATSEVNGEVRPAVVL